MDQTKNNMDRIRAFDAEEGEWRTINGAHVLIKNGRIAGGAGGALNGQPFRGGSPKKMQSGSKGMESGAYGRKLKSQAKEVAENNRAAMARANARYDRNHEARVKQMGNLMGEASKLPDHSPLEARYRNAYEALVREDQREGRATAATNHALNQEMFDLEGKAARHESNRGDVASRAQRALERYRKSREAERGGSTSPQRSAAYNTGKKRALEHIKQLTNNGLEDPEALAAAKEEASSYVKKWRDISKRNPGGETAEKQLGWYETLEKGWGDMLNSVNRSKSRGAERGGTSAPQQSAPHATKLGRMQPGSTAVNAGKEAKRLDHNARVYHRTARRAREAYNAKMDKAIAEQEALRQKAIGKLNSNALGVRAYAESHSRAETPEQATHKAAQYIKLGNKYRDKYRGMKESAENKQNEIERKKNDYKMKSYENVSRRDQEADNAKERLARMRKLAKALKARRPGSFKG